MIDKQSRVATVRVVVDLWMEWGRKVFGRIVMMGQEARKEGVCSSKEL